MYQIYTIKNTVNNKMFVGLTSGDQVNMLYWILRKVKTDKNTYINLQESVKQHGKNKHVFQRTNKIFDSKESGEGYLRSVQLALQAKDLLLNDEVVSTERYTCEHCKKTIKVIYKAKHDELYCTKSTNDLLDTLVPQEIDPDLGF